MNFIESTNFFVRTIMFDFINPDENIKIKFRLVPMVHIGTEAFYQQVFENLNECQEILYEGANIRGISLYTKIYKRIANRLDLVTQKESFNYKALKT